MGLIEAALLFGAGLVAGLINALAGGSGFLAFPAFVALGLAPIVANASTFVALLPANLVGFAANVSSLGKAHHSLVMRVVMAVLGGTLGSFGLIVLGSELFERAVPWLLLIATILFGMGPAAKRLLEHRYRFDGKSWPLLLYGFEFLICVYGGYFGLGMGIVMLAIYALLGQEELIVANAVKNLVVAVVGLIGVAIFWASGLIVWKPALVMAAGATIGGFVSAKLGHLVSQILLRRFILAWAVVLTAYAFWRYSFS